MMTVKGTADEGPGELELSDSQCEVVARFAAMLPFVVRTGILAAIGK